jgi:hypothetical protein
MIESSTHPATATHTAKPVHTDPATSIQGGLIATACCIALFFAACGWAVRVVKKG